MKRVFTLLMIVVAATLAASNRYYVSPEGTGQDGLSWSDAISLEEALAKCVHGDEVWVSQGTYLCSQNNDRTESFNIPSGVAIYGGFKGDETELSERTAGFPTILSGDIGETGVDTDNAFTVVSLIDADESTLLDGLTITGGRSMAMTRDRTRTSAGGGLYIASEELTSRPFIQNCKFVNNRARYGAAVYVNGTHRSAEPIFYSCSFETNVASFRGGGIYNDGEGGQANPRITACLFTANQADCGAGITNNGKAGESNPLIVETIFESNVSMVTGAAIYNLQGQNGDAMPVIQECEYRNNESELDEDVANSERVTMVSSRRQQRSGGTLQPRGSRTSIADRNK
ncbi:MAG: hypothetical protein AAFY36_07985 [Bacteroidota bacterium]